MTRTNDENELFIGRLEAKVFNLKSQQRTIQLDIEELPAKKITYEENLKEVTKRIAKKEAEIETAKIELETDQNELD